MSVKENGLTAMIKRKTGVAFILFFVTAFMIQNNFAQEAKQAYRLIISFGSECCGINKEAEKKIRKIISLYEKEKKVKLKRNKIYWGKEGEFDYCYTLSEISADEQIKLINKTKEIANASKLVEIRENSTNPNEN